MEQLIQTIILGVLIGGVYALMASGLTLVFGVMHIINVAQGAFLIASALITWELWKLVGLDPLLAALLTTPLMFVLGMAGLFNDFVMPSKKDSTAAVAFDFVMPVSSAIFAIKSCLFMVVLRSEWLARRRKYSSSTPRSMSMWRRYT